MRIIILSGLSGSGKTIALQTLEDLDCYCVDNLPCKLIAPLVQELLNSGASLPPNVALGVDARNFFDELSRFPAMLAELRNSGLPVEVVFLQANDQTLLQRYSETRRRHPLDLGSLPLHEAIRHERQLLEPVVSCADLIIDTSNTNLYQLRDLVRQRVHQTPGNALSLLFQSFGFKNGVPSDADFVFDVRCLPNPHWQAGLRQLNGRDAPVIAFLRGHNEVLAMLEDIRGFVATWLPRFADGNRSYLTVALGCTGGQHRSVFMAEALGQHFSTVRKHVVVRHRELGDPAPPPPAT